MHICVIKLTTIGSDNGLLVGWCQAIISTNAGILLTRTLKTNFREIKIYTCSLKNCIWKSCVLHNERKLCVILFTLYKKHVSFHAIVRPSLRAFKNHHRQHRYPERQQPPQADSPGVKKTNHNEKWMVRPDMNWCGVLFTSEEMGKYHYCS